MYSVLEKINSPADVKKLNVTELETLASDVREALFNRLTKIGGHFGPNFGMVEAEIALHYVFNSPVDKFVFDVSHQSYTHKILTGRKAGYICDEHFKDDSGYTNPEESEHDFFNVGHTSTSVSLASGLAKARDLIGGSENIIAVIGDGSLSGGEAFEGFDTVAELNTNMIIVVNDNQQSISETHGGIYKNLKALRESNGKCELNMFKAIGLDYVYEPNGNDIASLIKVFESVKDVDHPVVVHINTKKGKGYKLAEDNKEAWHWTVPFDRATGKPTVSFAGKSYVSVAHDYIMKKAETDEKFVVVTPNMPMSMGLAPADRQKLGKQFVDVGIAEEQAVAMASGLARGGANPLVVTNVTFMQRTYDQLSHDLCINGNHAVFLLNYAAFDGLTDVTHLGIFGIPAFSNIPNLAVLCPTCENELVAMLDWALDVKDAPCMILLPGNDVKTREKADEFVSPLNYETVLAGEKVAIIALGDFFDKGAELASAIEKELGFKPTLINPRTASSLDEKTLASLVNGHKLVITLEDGVKDGGLGQKVASYFGATDVKVKNYGLNKVFYDRYNPAELLNELGITTEKMLAEIKKIL